MYVVAGLFYRISVSFETVTTTNLIWVFRVNILTIPYSDLKNYENIWTIKAQYNVWFTLIKVCWHVKMVLIAFRT